ncbi:tRNA-queuosine alpha-mannosyltransferase domain-containing protein [Alkalimarinus alittae]|uniref:tRNA-queuosine alpha-mannosyltransferase n=1 Tax=Alkalimarinus alittae TaxID=2961619 RepID=A0ABY6N6P9_9ALTE|nr:DUF3524 domain-containing protein [Alkalimarinus alittae]UZE97657.1 DUF3524 domain-containing protein [Alkalimarinus alittae]
MPKKAKGLLLSAYDAGSHRYWREGLVQYLAEYDWTVVTLPARYFSWRIRGNPISFLAEYSAELSRDYDFIVATSMVDLATVKGIFPSLATTPSLMYFHENQFEYPKTLNQPASIEPQMVNLYAAMSADSLLFNSEFNRDSFFAGIDRLMGKLPDYVMMSLSQTLASKSSVIPVPINDDWFELPRPLIREQCAPIKLVWNHRWEYDKGPDRLLGFISELKNRKVLFELNIVGEAFRQVPDEFRQIKNSFSAYINTFGYLADSQAYKALLTQCDVVLSTAIHEFQGVSVMEAVSAGCLPLVPDRLSYRQLIPVKYRYASNIDSPEQESIAAVDCLLKTYPSPDTALRTDFQRYSWRSLTAMYRSKILALLNC